MSTNLNVKYLFFSFAIAITLEPWSVWYWVSHENSLNNFQGRTRLASYVSAVKTAVNIILQVWPFHGSMSALIVYCYHNPHRAINLAINTITLIVTSVPLIAGLSYQIGKLIPLKMLRLRSNSALSFFFQSSFSWEGSKV